MNTVNLVGRLTRDPETTTSHTGLAITRFSVAVDRPFKDRNTGEYEADFPNCVSFDKTADFIGRYFTKGQRIGITGRLQTGKYEHKDGYTVYTTDVVVERAEFVESKQTQGSNYGQPSANSRTDAYERPGSDYKPAANTQSDFDSPPENIELPFDL